MTDFPGFFRELWASTEWPEPQPFPWQTMLAERAASADWPRVISLPTASGKTACLDAAVFGLAATASRRTEERLPRRIWFVVDRRIVVDEAYERAQTIASRLASAQDGPVFEISQALRTLSGTERPLAVARLRGEPGFPRTGRGGPASRRSFVRLWTKLGPRCCSAPTATAMKRRAYTPGWRRTTA